MQIESFQTFADLERSFFPWSQRVLEQYRAHMAKVNQPRENEAIKWQQEKHWADEAMMWAADLLAEAEDYEHQSLGLACAENPEFTVVRARRRCHQMISVHTRIRHLERAADKRMMSIQGDLKNAAKY